MTTLPEIKTRVPACHTNVHDPAAGGDLVGNHFRFPQLIRPVGSQATVGGAGGRVFIDTEGRGKEV